MFFNLNFSITFHISYYQFTCVTFKRKENLFDIKENYKLKYTDL